MLTRLLCSALLLMSMNVNANNLYTYEAEILSVYDGDTVTANIDLGFNLSLNKVKLRLLRINAPEIRGKEKVEGKKSRDYLRSLILGKTVIIRTEIKTYDSFGRVLADIYLDGVDVNAEMVKQGYAAFKEY